jgi:dienelactone hydrolase
MRAILVTAAVMLLCLPPLGADDKLVVPTVDQQIRQLADDAPLALRFQGSSADDARAWQTTFAAKLRELLGPYRPPTQWQTVVERIIDLDDHRREELVLTAPGHPALPIYLLTPRLKSAGRRPGIVALHGHGNFGADAVVGRELTEGIGPAVASANYDYARQLVRRGYVVAAPCLTPFGRRLGDRKGYGGQDACGVTFIRMQILGKLLIAENLRDALWATEHLARHADVDPERLGCVGLSYGGRMTMLTAAVEPRLRVAVISGALNCMQERIAGRYGCGAQIIPGLLQYGDVPEIASLIAPRPCLWEIGSHDTLQPAAWVKNSLGRIERVYTALGAADKLQIDRFEGGHRWNGERAYPLLDQVLKR